MTPAQIRLAVGAVALIVVICIGAYYQRAARLAKSRGGAIVQTGEQLDENSAASVEKHTIETRVVIAREEYNRSVANDPSLAGHRNDAVPERVRELARARRLAREGAARGDEGTAGAEDAAER